MIERDPFEVLAVARSLAVDAYSAEVVAALNARGVESILLKGPSIADWLYSGQARMYVDADLLIAPSSLRLATDALRELGFAPFDAFVSAHAHPWRREADHAEIDLHLTIWGAGRPPGGVWSVLHSCSEVRVVGRTEMRVLTRPALAMHLALHAAQHRDNLLKPREDLRRALEREPVTVWLEAERIADRLWALGPFADGLKLSPAGERVLAQLPLSRLAARLDSEHAQLAIAFARALTARGWRTRAKVIRRMVTSSEPREENDGVTASTSRRVTAVIRRCLWLVSRTPATLLAMYRARGG